METPESIRTSLPTRGVGDLDRFQGRLLPYTNTGTVQEISEISSTGGNLPVQSFTFRAVHSPPGVHCSCKRSKTDGHTQGYKNPPVPRRLVGESQVPRYLSPAYPNPGENVSRFGMAGECGQIRIGTKTNLRFCRLPIRPPVRSGPTHTGQMAKPSREITQAAFSASLFGSAAHVPDRITDSHRETSSPRATTYETHTVASQKKLENTRISGQDHSSTLIPAPTSAVVAGGKQCAPRSTLTSSKACSANFYRRIKRRVGRSLRRTCCQRVLVSPRKQAAYKLSRTKSSSSGFKGVPAFLQEPTVENSELVLQQSSNPKSPTHPRPAECGSGQAIQAGPDHANRMVPSSGGFRPNMQQVASTSDRPLCHQVQQKTSSVCIPSAGHNGHSSGCTQHVLGGPGLLRLSTSSHLGQSVRETAELPLQANHSDRPWVAKHALVLGSGDHVQPNPIEPAHSAQSTDSTLQSDPSQKSDKPKSPCMAPRASAIKEQGFSEAVAARIEAQRGSTRSVYEAKWSLFTRWCLTNQVDFRTPPLKSVADFLMHLFQDRKLQPSTIDGYRSAIADKLGNTSINISKDENLTRLLDSFHRDRPKGRRGILSWNLSLVLHQLTKPPFEPIREASLKHLTFKTVFLLALGSGKRRSEIHAWQNKNIRYQSDWTKVSLYPSPSFLAKNQLAKEGPDSVAPVVIPALAPNLDKSLKSDRSLCPVRALRYYLDRTSDIRQNKELVFVSFKKGFDKDISPATISSWIKQTVILCYELSDQEAHQLHQVKAHDVRAFAASKAFQSGVSLEQILSACYWKSHNTFTQFYLKDVAWADTELYHLGPVVAAQQIHK